jgi:epoxyqueuosine reductase
METAEIVRRAHELGFVAVGIMQVMPHRDEKMREWMQKEHHADMQFFHRHLPLREDLDRILPDAQSIISVAMPYPDIPTDATKYFAAYSRCVDYHTYIKELLTMLTIEMSEFDNLICIDDKPVPERYVAQQSGVGWIGKNSCVIVPGYGSRILLGEIITTAVLDPTPVLSESCGDCRLCIDACPTSALQEDGTIDCRCCLSYLTIENKVEIPEEFGGKINEMIFGCDRCLAVCPHNNISHSGVPLQNDIFTDDITEYLSLTPGDYKRKFQNSPVFRAKRSGFIRNILIFMINTNKIDAMPQIIKLTTDDDPLVQQYAKWALDRIKSLK